MDVNRQVRASLEVELRQVGVISCGRLWWSVAWRSWTHPKGSEERRPQLLEDWGRRRERRGHRSECMSKLVTWKRAREYLWRELEFPVAFTYAVERRRTKRGHTRGRNSSWDNHKQAHGGR
jgi:hypothetical protein